MSDWGWEKVKVILARELNVQDTELRDEQLLREDLSIDSIVALNLIFSLERELSLTVTEEQIVSLQTIGDLRRLVARLGGA